MGLVPPIHPRFAGFATGLQALLSVAAFYRYINFVKEIPLTAPKCRKAVSRFYGDKPQTSLHSVFTPLCGLTVPIFREL